MKDAGDAEGDGAKRGTLNDEHAERNGDEDGDGHGDEDECEVLKRGAEDFGAMAEEEGPRRHAKAPGGKSLAGVPGAMAKDAAKACTSG